jgi:hypothetical protein
MWRLRLSAGSNGFADFQLPISDWLLEVGPGSPEWRSCRVEDLKSAIGNWKSEINK